MTINDVKRLEQENAELKGENERLKQQLVEIGKSWGEIQRLRRKNGIITGMCNSASNRFDKLYNTLQEIKAIAEDAMAKQQEYKKDFDKIIDLITKAESEEE